MNTDEGDAVLCGPASERVIGCTFTVTNTLGVGFGEKVYENALAYEMCCPGLAVVQQQAIVVRYDGLIVGEYTADPIVEDDLPVELKVAKALSDQRVAQCMNYLRFTEKPLCLLINFGRPRIELHRVTVGS